jgi:hypothetical protein
MLSVGVGCPGPQGALLSGLSALPPPPPGFQTPHSSPLPAAEGARLKPPGFEDKKILYRPPAIRAQAQAAAASKLIQVGIEHFKKSKSRNFSTMGS